MTPRYVIPAALALRPLVLLLLPAVVPVSAFVTAPGAGREPPTSASSSASTSTSTSAASIWGPSALGFTSRPKVFWFGANTSGLDNPDTLAFISRHVVAGYGWQTGHNGAGGIGEGEAWQAEATTHLRDYLDENGWGNVTNIFQYRQVQCALRLFAQCAFAADDPSLDGFWLHDAATGDVCVEAMPWGSSDPYWTFRNASAGDYWVDRVIGQLVGDNSLNSGGGAVFFDEVDEGWCGFQAGTCNFTQFNATAEQAASTDVYVRTAVALNAAGIVPIFSLDNRLNSTSDGLPGAPMPCALPQDVLASALANTTWVRFYETYPGTYWVANGPDTDAAMIANSILEAELGIPNVLHQGAVCPAPARNITRPGPLGGAIEFQIAVYLVVQSPGTLISMSDGWTEDYFCAHSEVDLEYGFPLGPPVRTSPYSWYRNYTRSNAEVDVSTARRGSVYLLP
jgi:hypothetical protein